MSDRQADPGETQETFLSHLIELRSRLVRAMVAVLAVPVIVSSFAFFLVGMAFAYFLVFPIAFHFFAAYTPAAGSAAAAPPAPAPEGEPSRQAALPGFDKI